MTTRTYENLAPFSQKESELLGGAPSKGNVAQGQGFPEQASPDNTVRAELLRLLLLPAASGGAARRQPLLLSDAWITGELDIHSMNIERTMTFVRCTFADAPNFCDTEITGSVQFSNCRLGGIQADRLCMSGTFAFQKTTVTTTVFLRGANIGSDLNFIHATLLGEGAPAVMARGITVNGDIRFHENCMVAGTVDISKANVSGRLSAGSATFDGKGKTALQADAAIFNGGISCIKTKALGEIRFLEAHIKGAADFTAANLDNGNEDAFSADRAVVEGPLILADGFVAKGTVRFPGARISDDVDLTGAELISPEKCCLMAEGVHIQAGMRFEEGFCAKGEVHLTGMNVGGDLTMVGSRFDNSEGQTITAARIVVQGAFKLKRTEPICRASFESSEVGHLIDDEVSWGGNNVLNGFKYGSFAGDAPTDAASRLRWLDKQISTTDQKAGSGFRPQPWQQLRRVLLEMGHFEDAREVGIAYEERLRSVGLIGQSPKDRDPVVAWLNRTFAIGAHKLFGLLIGYGYRPAKLVAWLVGVWFLSGMLYWYAALDGVMAPSNPIVFQNEAYKKCQGEAEGGWYLCSELPEEYTGFSPLAYSLDVLLPFVDLQQENDWAPKVPTPQASWYLELKAFSLKHAVRLALWFEIIFGWIAGVLLVAVVSGLTKRADE